MSEETESKNHSILLAEDNDDQAYLAKTILNRHPLVDNIFHTRDGVETVEFLEKSLNHPGQQPCLMLLDLKMPKLDGIDVLKQIKSRNEFMNMPIIILSTSDSPSDMQECYEHHANSYLVKKFSYQDYVTMLNGVCDYWLKINLLP